MTAGVTDQSLYELFETIPPAAPGKDPELGTRLDKDTLSLFDSYCKLTGDSLVRHLLNIRSRAWQIQQYPCIGQWGFIQPKIARSPAYQTVLERLGRGDRILDLGCCMGQDLRRLAAGGAPTENMYGSDIEPRFWQLGYDLFGDRDKMKAKFISADIFDPASPLSHYNGQFDIAFLGSLLHLWNWQQQADALRAIIKLMRPEALVIGCQLGRVTGIEVDTGWRTGGKTYFMHDPETIEKLWREASLNSDTQWEVTARTVDPERRDTSWLLPEARVLFFEAKRTR